jgi:hypothetical protein
LATYTAINKRRREKWEKAPEQLWQAVQTKLTPRTCRLERLEQWIHYWTSYHWQLLQWFVQAGWRNMAFSSYIGAQTAWDTVCKQFTIPSMADPVRMLGHFDKATVKKLHDLEGMARKAQLDLGLPRELWSVTSVRDFQQLAEHCERKPVRVWKLRQLLNVSQEKWEAACKHARRAIEVPFLADPIRQLGHFDKATVQKLRDLDGTARNAQLDLDLPIVLWSVTTVGGFKQLAEHCEQEPVRVQRLQQLLNVSQEKWEVVSQLAHRATEGAAKPVLVAFGNWNCSGPSQTKPP